MHYRGASTPILCVRVVGARGRGGGGPGGKDLIQGGGGGGGTAAKNLIKWEKKWINGSKKYFENDYFNVLKGFKMH